MKRFLLALLVLAVAFAVLTVWFYRKASDAIISTVHPAPNTEEGK